MYKDKIIELCIFHIDNKDKTIEELKAEISQLKADIKHDAKVCEDYDDGLLAEIKGLQVDNISLFKRLNDANKQTIRERVKHYPKEYKAEARDYFNHNPNSEKLWFFMVGDSEVDEDGDVRKTFNVGVDAIAECDNFNGDISTEVYR